MQGWQRWNLGRRVIGLNLWFGKITLATEWSRDWGESRLIKKLMQVSRWELMRPWFRQWLWGRTGGENFMSWTLWWTRWRENVSFPWRLKDTLQGLWPTESRCPWGLNVWERRRNSSSCICYYSAQRSFTQMLRLSVGWSCPRSYIILPSTPYHFRVLGPDSYHSLCLIMPSPVCVSLDQVHFRCHLFQTVLDSFNLRHSLYLIPLYWVQFMRVLWRGWFPFFILLSPPAWNLAELKQRANKMTYSSKKWGCYCHLLHRVIKRVCHISDQ